jgi:dTDP-4-dehydrorhamnose 3,5-epimerase
LRGLHFQTRNPQGKLLTVLEGEAYDAAVDLRPSSPTFGRAEGLVLRAGDHRSLWLPPGFAHGFLSLSEQVVYSYKVTAPWDPPHAQVLAWNDPAVGLAWPLEAGQVPLLSDRDQAGLSWAQVRQLPD